MTRYQANEILDLWKAGKYFPPKTINEALYATGDISCRLS